MVDKLRLEVLLSAVDKVTGPLKAIATGSKETAKAVKETEAALRGLDRQRRTLEQLGKEQERLAETRGKLSMAHAENASGKAITKLTKEYERQQAVVERLQATVREKGWSTAAADQRKLADNIRATNAQMEAQKRKLEQQAQVENRLHALREKHSSDMARLGMRGAMAAGAGMAGRRALGIMGQPVTAFEHAETATSQLRAAMMRSDGAVPPEFAKVNELAERLGDRLPGTTADFINMMTMLQRQGMTTQTILGGMGEAAAYLGVQLKMPVTAAAEFAAKMQDATQTAEGDLMGLMDTIQRSFYLGVDPTNMLQGFTKVGAVMPYLGKKGLEASNMLAPMLVMMDQAGMKGEAAGNAIRKIVQMSMNAGKLSKANKMLAGTGVQLDFYDKKGKFAGFDNLFAQLQKLKTIESDVQRTAVMQKLFGDDAETYQVLNTLMEKGKAGYDETVGRLQAQADLRMRVNEELKTLAAVIEAAQGSFTNLLKDLGAAIAPELKALIGWLGEIAASAGAWARENPRVVKTMMLLAAGVAGLMVVVGGLGVALVGVLAPLAVARFLTARFVLGLLAAKTGAAGAALSVGLIGRAAGWLTTAWAALRTMGVGSMFRAMGAAMASPAAWLGVLRGGTLGLWRLLTVFARANPIAALVLGLVGMFAGLYAHWDKIKEYFNAGEWWSMAKEIWAALEWGFNAATMGLYDLLKSIAVSALTGAWEGIKNFLGVGGGDEAPGASKARSVAAAAAMAAAVPLSAAADSARLDAYQPVLQPAAPAQLMPKAQAAPGANTTNQITIHAAPGMDEKAVARAVTFEMDRRERAKSSRVASQLHDID